METSKTHHPPVSRKMQINFLPLTMETGTGDVRGPDHIHSSNSAARPWRGRARGAGLKNSPQPMEGEPFAFLLIGGRSRAQFSEAKRMDWRSSEEVISAGKAPPSLRKSPKEEIQLD